MKRWKAGGNECFICQLEYPWTECDEHTFEGCMRLDVNKLLKAKEIRDKENAKYGTPLYGKTMYILMPNRFLESLESGE